MTVDPQPDLPIRTAGPRGWIVKLADIELALSDIEYDALVDAANRDPIEAKRLMVRYAAHRP